MNAQPDLTFPPDPTKPDVVVTETPQELGKWIVMERSGKVVIETIEIVPKHNSWWKLRLRWP